MTVNLWLVSFTLTVWIAVGFAGQLLFFRAVHRAMGVE